MANTLKTIKEIEAEILQVNSSLQNTYKEVLKISEAALTIKSSFSKISTPNEVNETIEKTKKATNELIQVKEKQRLQEIKLDIAREKAFDKFQSQLNKEKSLREKQAISESALRERLSAQKIKEEKQSEKAFENSKSRINKEKSLREKQVNSESALRQRLSAQRTKEEKQSETAIKNAAREAREIEKSLQVSVSLNRAFNVASRERSRLAKIIQDLNIKRSLGNKLSVDEERLLKKSSIQFKRYDLAIKKANVSVGRFQENVGNYPKGLKAAANSVRSLTSALGLVGGAFLFVRVMREALSVIVEFDKQIIAVQKTTNLTNKEIKEFSKSAVTLGIKLKGISTINLLKSAEIAGQLGIKGSANILKFSATLEKLKLTSDIAGEESARSFAQFIKLSSDTVDNSDRLGSVITELGNNFATTESQILANTIEIQKGISIYKTSAQEVIGLGAATSSLGLKAEQTRGAFQTTFKVLNESITTGKNLQKILELTGQTQSELTDEFGKNSIETFNKFIKGLSKIEKEGNNLQTTLKDLGLEEKRTEAVLGSLVKNYDILEDSLKRSNEEYINNIALTEEADKSSESLSSKIGDLGDAFDNLALGIEKGDGRISTFFKNQVDEITEIIGFIDKYNKTSVDVFNETEIDSFTDKTIRLKKEFQSIVEFAKSQGKEVLFEDLLSADLDKNTKDLIENSKIIKELSEKKLRLLEVEKLLKIAGPEKGAFLFEKAQLKLDIDRLDVAEKTNAVLQGEKRAIEELIKLQKTLDEEKDLQESFPVKELRASIILLEDSLKDLTKNGYEELNASQIKVIKDTRVLLSLKKRELASILNETKARKNSNNSLRKSIFDLSRFRLELEIKNNQDIVDNDNESTNNRISSAIKLHKKREELSILIRDFEIKNLKLLLEQKKITNEDFRVKEQLVNEKYNEESSKNTQDKEDNDLKVFTDSFKQRVQVIEAFAVKSEQLLQDEVTSLQNSLRERGALEIDIEEQVAEKISALRIKQLKDLIDLATKELSILAITAEQKFILEKKLSQLRAQLSDEELSKFLTDEEKKRQILEQSISGISEALNDAFGVDSRITNRFFDTLITNFDQIGKKGKASFEDIAEVAAATFAFIGELSSALTQGAIDNIDRRIEANNEFFDTILENQELTDQQKEALEERRSLIESQLQKKKEQAIVKQARTEKAFNIASATANIAVGISKALAQGGTILGIPFAAIVATLGAIQLGTILAQPIPQFADGGTMDHDGLMQINDHSSGRQELVKRDGKLYASNQKNAIVHGKKGDEIIPDAKEYLSSFSDNQVINNLQKHVVMANVSHQNHLSDRHELQNKLVNSNDLAASRIVKAINSQSRPVHLNQKINIGRDLRFLTYKKDTL